MGRQAFQDTHTTVCPATRCSTYTSGDSPSTAAYIDGIITRSFSAITASATYTSSEYLGPKASAASAASVHANPITSTGPATATHTATAYWSKSSILFTVGTAAYRLAIAAAKSSSNAATSRIWCPTKLSKSATAADWPATTKAASTSNQPARFNNAATACETSISTSDPTPN